MGESNQERMNDLKMAEILYTVATDYPELIPKMDWLRGLIDQNFKVTSQNQLVNALIFTFGFTIPFFLTVFSNSEALRKETYLKYLLATSIYFFLIELTQMIYLRTKYFKNLWNYFQIIFCVSTWIFAAKINVEIGILPLKGAISF